MKSEQYRKHRREAWQYLSGMKKSMRRKEQAITDAPTQEIAQMASRYWSSMQRDRREEICEFLFVREKFWRGLEL